MVYLLPRGVLREPIKHLQRASYVFLTKSKGVRDEELEAMIRKFNPEVEIIECAHKPLIPPADRHQRSICRSSAYLAEPKNRRIQWHCGA